MSDELTPDEERLFGARAAAYEFAKRCRTLEEHAAAGRASTLGAMLDYLVTELWDSGFSQTEIRQALEGAAKDLPRYAAGSERNGTGIRGTARP